MTPIDVRPRREILQHTLVQAPDIQTLGTVCARDVFRSSCKGLPRNWVDHRQREVGGRGGGGR